MLAIILLICGIALRFIPPAPNFTPVTAIALFGGFYLSKKHAVLLPLSLMILSDIFIGLHDTILFTWGSFVLIAAIGLWVKQRKSPAIILGASILSSVVFFLITNFGAWLSPLYPNTWEGFINCYTLAIPFFRTTLASSLLYSVVLFGSYELIAAWAKRTRFARVLLSA